MRLTNADKDLPILNRWIAKVEGRLANLIPARPESSIIASGSGSNTWVRVSGTQIRTANLTDKVGIGITSPANILDVSGSFSLVGGPVNMTPTAVGSYTFGADPGVDTAGWGQAMSRFGRTVSTVNVNEWGFVSHFQANASGSTVNFEKGAAYFRAVHNDTTATAGTRDVVALEAQGRIAAGNTNGRSWGINTSSTVLATGDGLAIGIETGVANNGSNQPNFDTTTSKYSLNLTSGGSQPATAGIRFNNTDAGWNYGILMRGIVAGGTAIAIPNNIPISARNAANTAYLNILSVDASNILNLGTAASSITVPVKATFTANPRVSGVTGNIELRDTGQVLPAGLWRVVSNTGQLQAQRNTAVAGDFSTGTSPFGITATDQTFINTGFYNDGSGAKHIRVTTGSIGAGLRADVTVTWGLSFPFVDANYTAVVTVVDTSAAGAGLRVERIRSISAASLIVQVINDSAGALTGTLHVHAFHD